MCAENEELWDRHDCLERQWSAMRVVPIGDSANRVAGSRGFTKSGRFFGPIAICRGHCDKSLGIQTPLLHNFARSGEPAGSKRDTGAIFKCPTRTPPPVGKHCDSVDGHEQLGPGGPLPQVN